MDRKNQMIPEAGTKGLEQKDQSQKELQHQRRAQEMFNAVTNSVKPENQNQEHNVRKEGIQPKNNKR